MNPTRDINNNTFSKLYQNKVFFYFVLVLGILLIVLKLPMASVFYETVCTLITFAPMVVILTMATIAYVQSKRYPDYQSIIRKFYLLFTLKFLAVIFVFYIFYAPTLFTGPIHAFFKYFRTLLTLEGIFFFLSYILTLVIAGTVIFVFFRLYQKSQGKYLGSITLLTRRTLYALFTFCFLILASSVAAYPQAYKPLTDTLGDAIYTASSGSIQMFKGSDPLAYNKLQSLGDFTAKLSKSISQTSKNISENNQEFSDNLDTVSQELKTSITQTSKDLNDKIKDDLTGKVSIDGDTIEGALILSGSDADLTVEGTTTTKDIVPDSTLSYNLGEAGKSWNIIYAHRLIGASPIFIGNNNSQKGLTNDGDLVVTNDAEIQNILYAKTLTIGGAYTLPAADGSANQLLKTDGSGTLSWVAQVAPGGTAGQIQFNSGGTFAGDTALFWDNSTKRLGINKSDPATELEVGGTVKATAFMLPGGIYLNSDTVSTNYWAEDAGNIFRETGNVGLGNNTPLETLDITGRIRLRPTTAPVTTTDRLYNVTGDLFWNGRQLLAYDAGTSNVTVAGTVSATNFFDSANSVYLIADSINGNYWGESGGNIYRETGNVSIGTNNANGYKLYVDGTLYGASSLTLGGNLVLGVNTLTTANTGLVSNLNADLLDSRHETEFALLAGRASGQTLVGGSGVTDILSLQGTSGNGTPTSPAIQLRVGNNGGTTAMTVNNNGNIGIAGAPNSAIKLTITGDTYSTQSIYTANGIYGSWYAFGGVAGSTSEGYWTSVQAAGLARKLYYYSGSATKTGGEHHFFVDGGEKLTILNSGNVGIGTTSPAASLEIIRNSTDVTPAVKITQQASWSPNNPYALHVTGYTYLDGFRINGQDHTNSLYNPLGGIGFSSYDAGSGADIIFRPNLATAMTIKTAGNVGIGTTSPGAKLDVQTSTGVGVQIGSGTVVAYGTDLILSGSGYVQSNSHLIPASDNARNLGISGRNWASLWVNGLTVASGNVGIGTTDPGAYKLNVVGTSYFSGTLTSAGNIQSWGGTMQTNNLVTTSGNVGFTMLPNNGGAGTTLYGLKIGSAATYSTATSGQVGWLQVLPTYNQASGTAANTDLLINRTETAIGSGAQLLIDAQVGGASKFKVSSAGTVTANKYEANLVEVAASNAVLQLGGGNTISSAAYGMTLLSRTSSASTVFTGTSGSFAGVAILPTYNQASGTAANTDLLINRTQTAVGSGAQLLIDAQVGGVSKFKVSNAGYITGIGADLGNGNVATSGTMRATGFSAIYSTSTMWMGRGADAAANSNDKTEMQISGAGFFSGYTNLSTGGSQVVLKIAPTYNQASSTAANTDLLINRTETSVGSGAQLLIDAQVGGVSKFSVQNNGVLTTAGAITSTASTITGLNYAASWTNPGTTGAYRYDRTITTDANQQIVKIAPTYNQVASTAANTDLLINRTQTAVGSGAQLLIDAQVGGVSKFSVDNMGNLTNSGYVSSSFFTAGYINTPLIRPSNNDTSLVLQNRNFTATGNGIDLSSGTASNSTGQYNAVRIIPTYNQTGAAAGTDLLINRAQTAVGSGAQLLIDAQVGGVSKFRVDNTGATTQMGAVTAPSLAFSSTASAATGYLTSTSDATKGSYNLNAAGTIVVDELNTRVGIGKTPDYALDIYSAGNTGISLDSRGSTAGVSIFNLNADRASNGSTAGQIKYFNNGGTPIAAISAIRGASDTTGTLQIAVSNATAMAFDATGNVAIGGVIAPDAKLHVKGAGATTGTNFLLEDSAGADTLKVLDNGTIQQTPVDSSALTDLLINPATKTSGSLLDAQINGTTKFNVSYAGVLYAASTINSQTGTFSAYANNTSAILRSGNISTANIFGATILNGTHSETSGSTGLLTITGTYNQVSGTAANTDLLINRTETAVGSGAQLLIDAQVGGTSKFKVDNTGALTAAGTTTLSALADGSLSVVGGVVTSSSDSRKKDKVGDINSVLSKVLQLDPLIYTWKDSTPEGQAVGNKEQLGFFAQDMEKYFPQLVGENKEGSKGLNYNGYTAVLTKAIQEQQELIKQDQTDILSISNEIKKINDKILNQDALIVTLQTQITELQTKTNQDLNLAQIDLNKSSIDYLNQLLGVDTNKPGDIAIIGQLTAKKVIVDGVETGAITISVIDKDAPTIGEATIMAGDSFVIVKTKAVTGDSKVFVTAEHPAEIGVNNIKKGESFQIEIGSVATDDLNLNWWIVEAK